jgi:hypothetical protein
MRRVALICIMLGVAVLANRRTVRDQLVRHFNKYILNPLALWLVAQRPVHYGVIHHIGRQSGRMYSTPVVAKLTSAGMIIPLPYGSETDWCRNLLAAGHGTLTLHGTQYAIENPTIVDADVAGPLVPEATARVWQWLGIEKYLQLSVRQSEQAELIPAA